MATILPSEYSPEAFRNILPGIEFSWKHVNVRGGRDVIFQELAPLFIKHNVAEKFGIGILHRHFDVDENERLVEVNNVSTPWKVGDAEHAGGSLVPTSWLFRGNSFIPYEFSFVGVEGVNNQPSEYPHFLEDLAAKLKELKLHRYLSLTVHPGPDFKGSVEFTAGRANVVVHPSMVPAKAHTLEASFFFDIGYVARGFKSDCVLKCDVTLTADDLAEMERLDQL